MYAEREYTTVRLTRGQRANLEAARRVIEMQEGKAYSLGEVVDYLVHYFIVNEILRGNIKVAETAEEALEGVEEVAT